MDSFELEIVANSEEASGLLEAIRLHSHRLGLARCVVALGILDDE